MNKLEMLQQEQRMRKPQLSLLSPQFKTVSVQQQPKTPVSYSSTNAAIPMKRLSVVEANLSEKFWVPEEIALTSQLSKKRTSIVNQYPGNAMAKVNEAFNVSGKGANGFSLMQ
jgi:hypothetical protein